MIITLLTDFGLRDSYAAIMKGIILGINPEVQIIDITHEIQPQDIEEAAFVLFTAYKFFPPGTIHVIVVDPGVGSGRRIIGARTKEHIFLAPDNGVLQYIFKAEDEFKVFDITRKELFNKTVSGTFHGRDIIAPIAAHLSRGILLEKLGEEITDFKQLGMALPLKTEEFLEGHIIHADRFGNLVTNIRAIDIPANTDILEISVANHVLSGIKTYYAQAVEGELLALINSSGFLEIAVRNGSAAERLPEAKKEKVRIQFRQ